MLVWLSNAFASIPASIRTKLLWSFMGLALLFVALATIGLTVLHDSDQRATELVHLQRKIAAFRQLQHNTTEHISAVTGAFLHMREADYAATERRLNQFSYDFDRARYVSGDEAQLLDSIDEDYAELVNVGTEVIRLLRNGDTDAARTLQNRRGSQLADRIERYTYTLVNRAEAEMLAGADESSKAYNRSRQVVIATAIVSTLLALLLGYIISRSLTEPVRRMVTRFKSIAGGEFKERLQIPNRDELGALAGDLNHMSGELDEVYRALEDASHHKSEFLATMSHEIRTPMNGVIGMTHLLMDTKLDEHQQDYTRTIRDSAENLLTIINDILDFSKVEAGRLELEEESFSIRECIEGALDLVAQRASEKDIELAYLMEPDALDVVVGDVTRLRQIILNLLNNAIKFTDHGEVVVNVSADKSSGDIIDYQFSVQDTGIGIPQDRLDRLFKSFSQVDSSTTRRYGGTGLGLAISKRLTELMQGDMWVESEEGSGSTFFFTARLRPGSNQDVADFVEQYQHLLAGKRALVVDDNATNRRILNVQCVSWQMLPQATASPAEALEWIKNGHEYDVVLTDMQMPDMDGVSLLAKIKEIPSARALPIIMLSSMGNVRSEAEQAGVSLTAFLSKPIKPAQLFRTLVSAFGGEMSNQPLQDANKVEFDINMANRYPLRLLLVDDHLTNRKLGTLVLQRLGYDIELAENGVEAVEALRRRTFDVVLMDVQMPEMDGLEATATIRSSWPEAHTRIIAMTATAMQGDREKCLAAGMDDYISKPIQIAELVRALQDSHAALPAASSQPVGGSREEIEDGARLGKQKSFYKGASSVTPISAGDIQLEAMQLDQTALDSLQEMIGGDKEMMMELCNSFLSEGPGLLQQLEKAGKNNDAKTMRMAAHTMKSSMKDFGATDLAELCQKLEDLSVADNPQNCEYLLKDVIRDYPRFELALRQLVGESTTGGTQ